MVGHDDAWSSHGSIGQGRLGEDDDDRGHCRENHHWERRHQEHGERRNRHLHRVNIMDFVRIGPPALTGEETYDAAEVS